MVARYLFSDFQHDVFLRHCEPTARANARPMTGSAKQSSSAYAAKWIASSQALLAMTGKRLHLTGHIWSQTLGSVANVMRLEGLRPQRTHVKEGDRHRSNRNGGSCSFPQRPAFATIPPTRTRSPGGNHAQGQALAGR